MAAKTDIIKEFLVGLGYKVDEGGQRRFVDGVNHATDVVDKLSTALKALATGAAIYGVVHWFDKVTGGLEDMYYAAKRSGSSVKELQSFGYAASQMGSSASQALSSAQAIYQFIRNQPNAPDWLRSQLGVNIYGADGRMKSGVEITKEVGAALNKQPLYLQAQYADQMGIPLELRMALQQAAQFSQFQHQYTAMLKRAGLNPDLAAKQARDYQRGARSIGAAFEIVRNSVMASLIGHSGATGALGRFRDMILSHVPQITRILSKLADAGVTAFGKFLDWLDTVDWDKVFNSIGAFFNWLLSLDPKQVVGYLKDIAAVLAVIFGLKMLAGVMAFTSALARLVPVFGGLASGLARVAGAAAGAGTAAAGATAAEGAAAGAGAGIAARVVPLATRLSMWALPIWALFHSESTGGKRRVDGTYEDELSNAQVAAMAAAHDKAAKHASGKPTRGIRNNNPGNIQYGPFATRHGATGADANGFAIFPSASAGFNAIGALLASYGRQGVNTAFGIAHRWSTTDQAAYTATLAKALGVDANQSVNLNDPKVINALRNGIILQENGSNPYAAELSGKQPLANAGTAPSQSLKAETHITVQGSSNPLATAREVAGQQDGVNQRLVRNFRQVYA